MKIDAMTGAAVAFAAFAAWYVLKPKTAAARTASGADTAFSSLREQRNIIGANTWQSTEYAGNLSTMGGGQGLQPSSGFWSF